MEIFIRKLTKENANASDFKMWTELTEYINEWSYKNSIIDDNVFNLLKAYELAYQQNNHPSADYNNLAKEILKCFLQLDTDKTIHPVLYSFKEELKPNCKFYKNKIIDFLINELFDIELSWTYSGLFALPSLGIMYRLVEENSLTQSELDEFFDSTDIRKNFFAINVVNHLDNSKLRFFQKDCFESKVRTLLLTAKYSRVINLALTYYRWDYSKANTEVKTFITSLLTSDNSDIRWNAVAYFTNHKSDYKSFVDEQIKNKLINDEDNDVRNKARALSE